MAEPVKSFLGKYELLEVIGDGAEGRVYKAVCNADNVPAVARGELVAVKRLKSTGHEKESQQFLRQIKILSKLNHPNIVRHKDSFVWREKELEEDIYCLVMELLDGEPLKSLIEKHKGGLPWEQASGILSHTLQALQYASKNGVIHRDLKPSNIYITTNGVPKLVDFGIARQDDGESTATSSAAGAKGTFDYMAPDFALQHGGFRGDEQSDIFSFGIILYYTLAGALPFPPLGEHADRGYYIRWLAQQPPNAEFRHPVFRVLAHARSCIAKCIDPDRTARFKTFDELMADFAQVGYRKLKHGSEVYEFTDWLGKGGFGEVFRARRTSDHREVAVKRLFSSGQSSRFVREAKILRNAAHPNLTEYVDFVEVRLRDDEREYYLILEYLPGMPGAGLRDRVRSSESGLDPTEALQIFVRYLDCLAHLHKNGIIHRDIKPGNLYAPAGEPQKAKIFDLGIAHDEEGTRTHGQVPGTLDFMPPEFATQTSGRGSPQSDVYSIGVTLYQSLTKKLPFPRLPEKDAEAWVAFFRRSENPQECSFEHPVFKTYPELAALLRRALAADPKRRFASAGAMRDEVKKILMNWGAPVFDYAQEDPTAATVFAKPVVREEIENIEVDTEAATRVADLPKIEREMAPAASPAPVVPEKPAVPPPPAVDPAELERQHLAVEEAEKKNREEAERLSREKQRLAEATRIKAREEAERQRIAAAEAEKKNREEAERLAKEKERQAEENRIKAREEAERLAREKEIQERQAEENRIKAREEAERQRIAAEAAEKKRREEAEQLAKERERKAAEDAERRKIEEAERLKREKERQAAEEVRRKEREAAERVEAERRRIAAAEAAEKKRIEDARLAKIRAERAVIRKKQMAKAAKVGGVFAAVVAVAVIGYFGWNKARVAMVESSFNKAVGRAHAGYNSGSYKTAISDANAALAIHKDDPAMQKLIVDANEQIKLHESYSDSIQNGQTAFTNHDYSNAVDFAAAALKKMPDDLAATKLEANAQDTLDAYHKAVNGANVAFKNSNFADASTEAEKALVIYPNDAAMQQIKNNSLARIASQQAYTDAMKKAQAALNGGDFTNAVVLADAALQKFPGDQNATSLRKNAQDKLDKYHTAVGAAESNFRNNNFDDAENAADQALAIYPNDAAMKQLKTDAQTQAGLRAAYTKDFNNAQTAFNNGDYTNSLAWTAEALKQIANDPKAADLKNKAQKFLDDYHAAVSAANAASLKSDFATVVTEAGKALAIYKNDRAMQQLQDNAQTQIANVKAYNDALSKAQTALDSHNYTSAETLAKTALEKRPGDAAAIKIRDSAHQFLSAFDDTVTQAQAALKKNDFAGAVTLANQALDIRKDDPTAQKIKADVLKQLDGYLVQLMEDFNVSVPAELKSAEIQKGTRLTSITTAQRTYYQTFTDALEKGYRAGNWLGEANRQACLHDLRQSISNWD
ncbi:MAG TPA: protein kinase [Verrucomicrobiae bacterium]